MNEIRSLELSISKCKSYIKRYPDRIKGYYCLGRLYDKKGEYKKALECFNKSPKTGILYKNLMASKIEILVKENNILQAVKEFDNLGDEIKKDKIFRRFLAYKLSKVFWGEEQNKYFKLFNTPNFRKTISRITRNVFDYIDNLPACIILCAYFYKNSAKGEKEFVIYNICVELEGINNDMRWDLMNLIKEDNSSVLDDKNIISKFYGFPSKDCQSNVLSSILQNIIDLENLRYIRKIFEYLENNKVGELLLTPSSMWKYVYIMSKHNLFNQRVLKYSLKLMDIGWIDKVVISAVKKSMEKGEYYDQRIMHIIELFGY